MVPVEGSFEQLGTANIEQDNQAHETPKEPGQGLKAKDPAHSGVGRLAV